MPNTSYTLTDLARACQAHATVTTLESGTGRLLLSSYGARCMGLFPRPDTPNTLWVNPDVGAHMEKKSWMVGGERLWIAPERHFFYENPRDFEEYHVPAGLDPGNYSASQDNLTYTNDFSLLDLMTNDLIDNARTSRSFSPLDDPYGTDLAYCGVSITDIVRVPGSPPPFSGWSIAQVWCAGPETPGTVFCPIAEGRSPLAYFDPIPAERAETRPGYARFLIDSAEIYKFAVAPEDLIFENPLKILYLSPFPGGDEWFLVAKRSHDLPRTQEECVDTPKGNPEGLKGAIQAYNSGPGFGDAQKEEPVFGEIELQLKRAEFVDNAAECKATHELIAYAGSRDALLALAKSMLQTDTSPALY